MEPLRLLDLIARRTDHCLIWSHYYDKEGLSAGLGENFARRFPGDKVSLEHAGYRCEGHIFVYDDPAGHKSCFAGGTAPTSIWLSRNDILGFLKHLGFSRLQLHHETPPICPPGTAGPHFTIAAEKETATGPQ